MPETDQRSPRSFAEVALELGLCSERNIRDALLVKQKLAEMDVQRSLEAILVERGYISSEGIKQIEKALKGDNQLGGFELVEKIGQGAMGAVFRAKQVSLDRIVAVKILPRSLADDPAFVDRFLREARNVARLNHPNIIQGIDAGEDRGYYYFAMEYVDGPTLNEVLEEQGPLAEKEALRIVLGVAKALGHAWKNHILHRDIKPANVMLTADKTVKLCDLGLATALTGDAAASSAGKAVGTPYYISPEQAQGRTDIDTRSDIYSLGATLYHLLTGHPPFEGFPAAVVLAKHVGEKVTPIASFRPDVSKQSVTMMARMMAKDADQRHQNPAEVIEDIEDVLGGKGPGHSVRFRQSSTLPLPIPAGRQTGHHTAAVQRKIQARKSQSANAAVVFVVVLLLAIAAAFYFLVYPELSRGPVRPPGPSGPTPTPIVSPTRVTRPAPRPTVTPAPARSAASKAETRAREALQKVEAALGAGGADYEDYLRRLKDIASDNDVPAELRKGAERLTGQVTQRVQAVQRLENIAGKEMKSLLDAGDFVGAAGNLVAIERCHEFMGRFAGEMRSIVTSGLRHKLDSERAGFEGLLKAADLDPARRRLQSLSAALEAPAATLGLDDHFGRMRKALADAEKARREAGAQRMTALAKSFVDLRRSAGDRLDYGAALGGLPADLPADLRRVLEREVKRFQGWLDGFTRKVADLRGVDLKYRGGSIRGRASYEGAGRLKITTPRGLVIGISMKGVSSDDLRAWMRKTGEYDVVKAGRALLFFERDEEALRILKSADLGKDLALIVEAMQASLRIGKLEDDAEALLRRAPARLDSAECGQAAAEARALLGERQLPDRFRGPLQDLASALRERILSLNVRMVCGKVMRRGDSVEILYEATSPEHFADWRGIDGREWRYLAPGLESVGDPGRLASGVLFAPPVSITIQAELKEEGQLVLRMGDLTLNTAAGRRGSLRAGKQRANVPPLSAGRTSFMLRWRGSKAEVQVSGRKAEIEAPRSPEPTPLILSGAGARLWAVRIEGLPMGPADALQEKLVAAREALRDGRAVSWPVGPGLPGWLVVEGDWEYRNGSLRSTGRRGIIAPALLLPDAKDKTRLRAWFTFRGERTAEERWSAGSLTARWAAGGSVTAGIFGTRTLTVSCREVRDRARIESDSEDEEITAEVNVGPDFVSIEAKGETAELDIEPEFRGLPDYVGFQRDGGPGEFKGFRLRLAQAE